MRRTLSLALVAAVLLSGCGLKLVRVKPDPMQQPATRQQIEDLRKDLSQSFMVLYQALAQKIEAPKAKAAAAKPAATPEKAKPVVPAK